MSAESVRERASPARRVAHAIASGSIVGWVLALALAWSSAISYWGELAASTRPWLELSVVLPALACWLVRWRVIAAGACGLAVASASTELWVCVAPRPASTGGELACLVTANLLAGNTELRAAFATLRAQHADVIALEELTDEVLPELARLADDYPFQLVFPEASSRWDSNTWGLAIASRHPFTTARALALEEGAFPLLEVELELAGQSCTIRATHAPDPSSTGRWRARQRHFALVAARDWPPTAVLCGDLNATPGSADFRTLLARTGLADTRQGFGAQPSWGADQLPLGLAITLDHVLAGPAWSVALRETFELPGSDHRGVRCVLALR